MSFIGFCRRAAATLVWLPLALGFAQSDCAAAAAVEETFAVLQTKTGTYTNVTVTSKTKDWILILHSAGMINIKIADLPDDVQERLGYRATPQKPKAESVAALAKHAISNIKLTELGQFPEDWRERAKAEAQKITSNPVLACVAAGVVVMIYLFFCYCSMLICCKTHTAPGVLVWVPVFQILPLLRAAGMSRLWFVAFLVPLLNVVAQIVWFVNIVRARGKSLWVALWLALPPTGPFAFLYLAFSCATPLKTKSLVPLALETA